jgi:hypothetical protein
VEENTLGNALQRCQIRFHLSVLCLEFTPYALPNSFNLGGHIWEHCIVTTFRTSNDVTRETLYIINVLKTYIESAFSVPYIFMVI